MRTLFMDQAHHRLRTLGRVFWTDLWRGDLTATMVELQQTSAFWQTEIKANWDQPDAQGKLKALVLFSIGWLLLILAIMVFAFFLLPLLIFAAFIRAVRCSFGMKP